jgi:hypothetical protein
MRYLLPLLFLLAGCAKPHPASAPNSVFGTSCLETLSYFQDPNTDLCFAYCYQGSSYGGPALAHVPCHAVRDAVKRTLGAEEVTDPAALGIMTL